MSRGVCNKVAFNITDIPKTFWHDCSTTTLDTFAWHCLVVGDLRMYFIYAWGKLLTLWCGFEETFEFDVCQILWFSCVLATWVWLVTVTEMVIGNFNFECCEKLSFSFRIFQSLEVFPPVAKLANFIYFNFLSRIKFKNTTIQILKLMLLYHTLNKCIPMLKFDVSCDGTILCELLQDRDSLLFLFRERDERKPLLKTAPSFHQLQSPIRND